MCLPRIRWRKRTPSSPGSLGPIACDPGMRSRYWRPTGGETPVVHLTAAETWRALRRAQRRGVIGGQTYDMLIATCALKAGALTILTWNVRHFVAAAPEIGVEMPP